MILGGIGCVCRVGAGGSQIGYRESYLSCVAYGATDISQLTAIELTASARIKNGTEWVELGDVEQFSVSTNDEASTTANLTLRNMDKWSNIGGDYPGLLSPSNKRVNINCTVTANGTDIEFVLFTGNITGYSESIGRNSSAITLVCRAMTQGRLEEGLVDVTAPAMSYYRILEVELAKFGFDGAILLFLPDAIEPAVSFSYSRVSELTRALFGWLIRVTTIGSGLLIDERGVIDSVALLDIDDNVAIQESRSVPEERYNAMRTAVLDGDGVTWVYDEVYDTTDVAARGKIYAPKTLTSTTESISVINARALNAITEQLIGNITIACRFNPLAMVRSRVEFSGAKMKIDSGYGVVSKVGHRYRFGDAKSDLSIRILGVE